MKTRTLPTQPDAKSPAGAGFWLGLSGIRAALQALEQTGPDTSLKEALFPYFGIRHLTRLKTIVYTANFQHRIADFSKILFEHAEQQAL